MAAGSSWRREQDIELLAWHTAHMLNVSGKTIKGRVTVKKLLSRPTTTQGHQEWWDKVEEQRRNKPESKEGD